MQCFMKKENKSLIDVEHVETTGSLVVTLLPCPINVQMMGYREIIVTKPYLVSKEAQLYSL